MIGYVVTGIAPIVRASNALATPAWSTPNANGDLIVYLTEDYSANDSPPNLGGNYSANFTPLINCPSLAGYLRIATAANEALPSSQWGNSLNTAMAFSLTAQGAPMPSLASILAFIAGNIIDRETVSTQVIVYPSITVSQNNCAVVAFGRHRKTAAANGATIGNMAPDTSFGAPILVNVGNNTSCEDVVSYWQQTTATNTSSSNGNTISLADASDNVQSVMFAIPPPVAVAVPVGMILT